jgi:SNF2 family DNA or RNA helicase
MIITASDRGWHIAPVTNDDYQAIRGVIGSAKIHGQGDGFFMQVSQSVHNLRRLRRFFPSAVISDDRQTQLVAQALEAEHARWTDENLEGMAAKAGANFIPAGYEWKSKPFAHQLRMINFLHAMHGRCGLFGDPGVGKTYAIVVWIDQCLSTGVLKPGETLILTKPSIIDSSWLDDIKRFTHLRPFALSDVDGDDSKELLAARKAALKSGDYDLFIVGYEMARSAALAPGKRTRTKVRPLAGVLARHGFKCVVLDESTEAKRRTSRTFMMCRDVTRSASRGRVVATGTPAPNGPEDLWGQMYIVDRGMSLESTLTDFRGLYYNSVALRGITDGKGNQVLKFVPRKGALEEVHKRIAPRVIRIRAEECLDLPETMPDSLRVVHMTREQNRVYEEMKVHLVTELEGTTTSARQQVVQLMKLREITGGFVINDAGDAVAIPGPNPKLLELDDLLAEITQNNKAVVWAQYRWEFATLLERYKQYRPGALYGGTPKGKVGDIVRDFQTRPECQVLFCHPQSAGWGLTLTAANYSITYSLSYDGEEHSQARMRIKRIGQSKTMFYYYILAANSIDRVIYRAVKEKKSIEDLLIDGPRSLFS